MCSAKRHVRFTPQSDQASDARMMTADAIGQHFALIGT